MSNDNIIFSSKSLEETKEINRQIKRERDAWNKGLRGKPYQPTRKEEMNLTYGNQGTYIGKGPLY